MPQPISLLTGGVLGTVDGTFVVALLGLTLRPPLLSVLDVVDEGRLPKSIVFLLADVVDGALRLLKFDVVVLLAELDVAVRSLKPEWRLLLARDEEVLGV